MPAYPENVRSRGRSEVAWSGQTDANAPKRNAALKSEFDPKRASGRRNYPSSGLLHFQSFSKLLHQTSFSAKRRAWCRFQSSPSEEAVEQHQCQFSSTDTISRA